MMGRRVYPKSTERGVLDSEAGDYFKGDDGFWYAKTPNGLNANLSAHQIEEHEDKTVSVQPSILVNNSSATWHGFLTRGVWREC